MAITLSATSQDIVAGSSSPASFSVTPSPARGNLLVATFTYQMLAPYPPAPVELSRSVSGGGLWTEVTHAFGVEYVNFGFGVSVWHCLYATGGLSTVSGTLSGTVDINSIYATFNVNEFSGGTGVWVSDGSNSTVTTATTQTLLAGSFTTTKNGDLIVGAGYFNFATSTSQVQLGVAVPFNWDNDSPSLPGVSYDCGGVEWGVQASAGAINADMSTTSTGQDGGPMGAAAYAFIKSKPNLMHFGYGV